MNILQINYITPRHALLVQKQVIGKDVESDKKELKLSQWQSRVNSSDNNTVLHVLIYTRIIDKFNYKMSDIKLQDENLT